MQRSILAMHVTLVQTYCSMVRMQKMVQTFAQEGFYSRGECQHSFLEKITSALFLKLENTRNLISGGHFVDLGKRLYSVLLHEPSILGVCVNTAENVPSKLGGREVPKLLRCIKVLEATYNSYVQPIIGSQSCLFDSGEVRGGGVNFRKLFETLGIVLQNWDLK